MSEHTSEVRGCVVRGGVHASESESECEFVCESECESECKSECESECKSTPTINNINDEQRGKT